MWRLRVNKMDFDKICESRFSARNFSDIRVSEKKIRQIIEIIRLAPTALNHQPYKIIVANSDKAIEKLNRAKATLYNAKSVLIICSDRDNTWANRYSGENGILLDIGIITATALYAAAEHGLDSCCVCNFDSALLHGEFDLPDNLIVDALILLGYKTEDCKPSERHSIRRAAEEFTEWL